jgi:ATP-dependent RNA helicase SUPV3L1/SUV3
VSLPRDPMLSDEFYNAIGYRIVGPRALRVDQLERLAAALRRLARQGPFTPSPDLASLAGCRQAELPEILTALGYRAVADEAGTTFVPGKRRRPRAERKSGLGRGWPRGDETDSPFAKLRELRFAR